jgi:hypothetical protein
MVRSDVQEAKQVGKLEAAGEAGKKSTSVHVKESS